MLIDARFFEVGNEHIMAGPRPSERGMEKTRERKNTTLAGEE